jgi:hypothetical protein
MKEKEEEKEKEKEVRAIIFLNFPGQNEKSVNYEVHERAV